MAEYHVGCGIAGIYAGTLKSSGDEWRNKSDATKEAINAVAQYMYFKIPEGENSFAYGFKTHDGNYIRLKVESSPKCPEWVPEWVKEKLERKGADNEVN